MVLIENYDRGKMFRFYMDDFNKIQIECVILIQYKKGNIFRVFLVKFFKMCHNKHNYMSFLRLPHACNTVIFLQKQDCECHHGDGRIIQK